MTENGTTKRYTQARGRARREALLAAARALLLEKNLDELTLPMVSERAAIPPSSTYHFFADLRDLYKELARIIADEMAEIKPPPMASGRWQDGVRLFLEGSAAFFNADAAARQLLLGPKVSSDIKRAACHDDLRFGVVLNEALASAYHLPRMTDPVRTFFFAIQIADTFFSLSVFESERVTPYMLEEAITAAVSYLGNYLPPYLEPKKPAEVQFGTDWPAARIGMAAVAK